MFVGHLAVALGGKTVEPRVPLAAYVAGAFGLDLIWPLFLLAGIETVRIEPGATAFTPLVFLSYPWSHSLLMSVLWGGLAALVAARSSAGHRGALLIGLVVVSHWVLDWITHIPDLPLWPGGPTFGLGLWNWTAATLLVEGALFLSAIAIYSRAMPARDGIGRWAFWVLVALVTAVWASGPIAPPPPGVGAIIAASLLLAALLAGWSVLIDRHRGP